ncbi:MAG TPA: DUF6476 family protein [Candidatus Cybelea sp.]|nr:DUF6476 family protein [Candidatus Cybelea sp.]
MVESSPNIRLLKGIVIGLGVLIIAGVVVIFVTIANRMPHARATVAPNGTVIEPPANFGERKLSLPVGSRLVEIRPDGERLILRLRQVGGNEQIMVISMQTGERLGLIDLGVGAATGPNPSAGPGASVSSGGASAGSAPADKE